MVEQLHATLASSLAPNARFFASVRFRTPQFRMIGLHSLLQSIIVSLDKYYADVLDALVG